MCEFVCFFVFVCECVYLCVCLSVERERKRERERERERVQFCLTDLRRKKYIQAHVLLMIFSFSFNNHGNHHHSIFGDKYCEIQQIQEHFIVKVFDMKLTTQKFLGNR